MPRYFAPITVEELKAKIEAAWEKEEGYIKSLTPEIEKDLSKVQFDTENISVWGFFDEDVDKDVKDKNNAIVLDQQKNFGYPLGGFRTLPNGMVFLGFAAGGDWEVPVYAIIYWSGKELRGYIPTKGNAWNKITKQAFGNADFDAVPNEDYLALEKAGVFKDLSEEEQEELKRDGVDPNEWVDKLISEELLIQDIQERIQPQSQVVPRGRTRNDGVLLGHIKDCIDSLSRRDKHLEKDTVNSLNKIYGQLLTILQDEEI